jgi:hypothetical protein
MQAILCTQCQSQNPHYTKFCLTCGSAVTPPRAIKNKVAPKVESALKVEELNVEATPSRTASKMEAPAAPISSQQERAGWLRGLKRLWFF